MAEIIGYADYPYLVPASNSVNLGNMDPNFMNPLNMLASDFYATYGRPLRIADAWRSTETQAKAYNDWLAGRKQVPVVAKPGTSRHESGTFGLARPGMLPGKMFP